MSLSAEVMERYNVLDWKQKEACNLIAIELMRKFNIEDRKVLSSFWILKMVKNNNTTDKITEEIQKYRLRKELFGKFHFINKRQLLHKLNNSF